MSSITNSPWLPNVLHCKVSHMCQRNYHPPLLMRNSWTGRPTNVVILLRYIFDVVPRLFSGSGISLGGGGITGVCGFMLVHGIGLSWGRCCNHFLLQLMLWLMMIDDFLFFQSSVQHHGEWVCQRWLQRQVESGSKEWPRRWCLSCKSFPLIFQNNSVWSCLHLGSNYIFSNLMNKSIYLKIQIFPPQMNDLVFLFTIYNFSDIRVCLLGRPGLQPVVMWKWMVQYNPSIAVVQYKLDSGAI